MIDLEKIIPVLHIVDEDKARAFYLEKLGFELDFAWRHEPGFPIYMGIKKGELYLHLSEHGKEHNTAELYVFVDNLEEWHERCLSNGVDLESGPQKMPWGNTDMLILDPFRNSLRISQMNTHKPTHESA